MALSQTVQSSVGLYAGKRYEGQIDTLQVNNVSDAILETANVGMGLAVAAGSADGIVKPFNAIDASFGGVTVRRHTLVNAYSSTDAPAYETGHSLAMLNMGYIVVKAESAVVKGNNAFIRYVAGAGGTVLGSFRADVDTASAVEVAGLVYAESADAGDMVRLAITRIFE